MSLLLTSCVHACRRLRDILIVFDRLLARGAQKPGSYGALSVLEPGTRVSSGASETIPDSVWNQDVDDDVNTLISALPSYVHSYMHSWSVNRST